MGEGGAERKSTGTGLDGRMLGLALLWAFITPEDLQEAQEAASREGGEARSALRWLRDAGRLDSAQWQELREEVRLLAAEAEGELPTARYRAMASSAVPEARLVSGAQAALPRRASGSLGPDILVSGQVPFWGPFERLRLIGEGGMARIFKAFDPRLRRSVAIKVLRRDDPEQHQRFILEAQAQALVEHPHVCRVFEAGEIDGQAFIAMQLIEGSTLKAALGGISMREKAEVMVQVCEGVHAAHRRGLIHRDLKPANLMVERDEDGRRHAFVLDFGLARQAVAAKGMTATGFVMGTVAYMPPEQARGDAEKMDRRVDVYALGATLYELLTGVPPHGAAEGLGALRKIVFEEPMAPRKREAGIPRDLETIVLKCLEKEPSRRYDTARALGDDLQRWLDGDPILARPTSARERVARFARRNKAAVAVAGVALLAVMTASALAVRSRLQASAQARWAQHFGQEAERLESLMRYGRLLPPHDIRRERRAMEMRLRAMEREIAVAGRVAQGPGAYALGRTWLALGDPAKAREHLQGARAVGFRGPEVNWALGRAHGMLYERELDDAQKVLDPEIRKARLAELQRTLGSEALGLLRSGQGSALEPPEYQEGLLALYDGRLDHAQVKARDAFRTAPWFYESKLLEAQVHFARARLQKAPALIRANLVQVSDCLAAAKAVAPSDNRLFDLESLRWQHEIDTDVAARLDPREAVEALQRNCASWQTLEPESHEPKGRLAFAFAGMASYLRGDSRELERWTGRVLELADPGSEAGRLSTNALLASALAYRLRARNESMAGRNPMPLLDQAIASIRQALQHDPHRLSARYILLRAQTDRLEYLNEQGQDVTAIYLDATTNAEGLAKQYPDTAFFPGTLGALHVEKANNELHQGFDPTQTVQRATEELEKARRLDQFNSVYPFGIGNSYLILSEYEISNGRDAELSLRKSVEAYEIARVHAPTNALFHLGVAMAFELRARREAAAGRDPGAAVHRAEVSLAKAKSVWPSNWLIPCVSARLQVYLAGFWMRNGKDPGPWLIRAESNFREAMRINSNQSEIFLLEAQIQRVYLEGKESKNGRRWEIALRSARRATDLDPKYARAIQERDWLMTHRP